MIAASKNTGQNKAFKEDDPRMIVTRSHFNELEELGEVRATRFVDEWVNNDVMPRTTRDDNNGERYLPAANGYCPMYARYMHDIGFTSKTGAKGGITVSRDPSYTGESIKPTVLQTYVSIWKRDYPLLKLNKRTEDICELCF